MKQSLIGEVVSAPQEGPYCTTFNARFSRFEEMEVKIEKPPIKRLARMVKVGDRVLIRKWANIGYLKIVASDIERLVNVPA